VLANCVRFITNTNDDETSIEGKYRIIDLLDELGFSKMNIGNTLLKDERRGKSE